MIGLALRQYGVVARDPCESGIEDLFFEMGVNFEREARIPHQRLLPGGASAEPVAVEQRRHVSMVEANHGRNAGKGSARAEGHGSAPARRTATAAARHGPDAWPSFPSALRASRLPAAA